MTNFRGGLTAPRFGGSIGEHLAILRGDIDEFTRTLSVEYGEDNEAAQRAEQLSAAIQRLEWALARQRPRSRTAMAGGS